MYSVSASPIMELCYRLEQILGDFRPVFRRESPYDTDVRYRRRCGRLSFSSGKILVVKAESQVSVAPEAA